MGSVESVQGGESSRVVDREGSPFDRFRRWRRERNMGYVRLRADFETYREEFDTLVSRADGEGTFWHRDVVDLFENVEEALDKGRVEDGWRHFHAAQRLETHGLEALDSIEPDADALRTRAKVVRTEALGALGGKQKESVEELLGAEQLDDDVTGETVRAASEILHEQYEGVHLKRYYLQNQFSQLFWLGTIAAVLFLVLSILPYFGVALFLQPPFTIPAENVATDVMTEITTITVTDPAAGTTTTTELDPTTETTTRTVTQTPPVVTSAGFVVFVALSGMIGASLFGMRSLQKKRVSTKVAQRITGLTVTWARGLIGAISAVLFYFFLQTSFAGGFSEVTAPVFIVVGFAAGYSERMVSRAVETVSGATTETDDE